MKGLLIVIALCCSLATFAQQQKPIENTKSNPVITLDKQGNQVCPKNVKVVDPPKKAPKRRRNKRSIDCGWFLTGCPSF